MTSCGGPAYRPAGADLGASFALFLPARPVIWGGPWAGWAEQARVAPGSWFRALRCPSGGGRVAENGRTTRSWWPCFSLPTQAPTIQGPVLLRFCLFGRPCGKAVAASAGHAVCCPRTPCRGRPGVGAGSPYPHPRIPASRCLSPPRTRKQHRREPAGLRRLVPGAPPLVSYRSLRGLLPSSSSGVARVTPLIPTEEEPHQPRGVNAVYSSSMPWSRAFDVVLSAIRGRSAPST